MNKFLQLMLGERGDQFGYSSSRRPPRRMFVKLLHNLFRIRSFSHDNLDLGQVSGVLYFRTRSKYRSRSSLQVFDMWPFNILTLVSLHSDGDEDVEPRCEPQVVANEVGDFKMCSSLNLVIGC